MVQEIWEIFGKAEVDLFDLKRQLSLPDLLFEGHGCVGPRLTQPPHLRFSPDRSDPAGHQVNQGTRAVRYDDIYRMDEIKSLLFHIMLYRLFCGVPKYIVYGNTFHHLDDCDLYTPPRGVKGRQKQVALRSTISQDKTRSWFLNERLHL